MAVYSDPYDVDPLNMAIPVVDAQGWQQGIDQLEAAARQLTQARPTNWSGPAASAFTAKVEELQLALDAGLALCREAGALANGHVQLVERELSLLPLV